VYHAQGCDVISYKNIKNFERVFTDTGVTKATVQSLFSKPIIQYKFRVPVPWSMGDETELNDDEMAAKKAAKSSSSGISFKKLVQSMVKKNEVEQNWFTFSDASRRFLISHVSSREYKDFPFLMSDYAKVGFVAPLVLCMGYILTISCVVYVAY
jgi:hypothetical protein